MSRRARLRIRQLCPYSTKSSSFQPRLRELRVRGRKLSGRRMGATEERPHVSLDAPEANEQLIDAVTARYTFEPGATSRTWIVGGHRIFRRGDQRTLDGDAHLQRDPVRWERRNRVLTCWSRLPAALGWVRG